MKIALGDQQVFYTAGATLETNTTSNPPPGQKTIVFLHGAGLDHSVWVMPSRYFARHGFRVVAPDLPKHGATSGPLLQDINAFAEWVVELLEALCIERCNLVGHSMGSLIAFALAAKHPARAERMALLGTASPMRVGEGLLSAAKDSDAAAYAMANTWSHSRDGKFGRSGQPGLWNMNTGLRLMQRCEAGVFHADLAACNAFDAEAIERVSQTPTLIIAGSKDQMTPVRVGHKLAERIDDTQTVLLPGSGHAMLSEQPNAVLDALAAFLMEGNPPTFN